jgi:hypothetical protein
VPIVMRGLVPRIYPFVRPQAVLAPQWVGPRNKSAGDAWTVIASTRS